MRSSRRGILLLLGGRRLVAGRFSVGGLGRGIGSILTAEVRSCLRDYGGLLGQRGRVFGENGRLFSQNLGVFDYHSWRFLAACCIGRALRGDLLCGFNECSSDRLD